jgi:outer membrane protein assembly factor BamB
VGTSFNCRRTGPQAAARGLFWMTHHQGAFLVSVGLLLVLLSGSVVIANAGTVASRPPVHDLPANVLTGGDYPTYLGGVTRLSQSTTEVTINQSTVAGLKTLWTYSTGGSVLSQIVEDNATVFAGAGDGYEYALNATTGALLWRTFLGQMTPSTNDTGCEEDGQPALGVTSTATVSNGTVYVGGGYPYLYALNERTGQILWRTLIGVNPLGHGFYNWASPLVYAGYAYVGIASVCDEPLIGAGLDRISLATHAVVDYFNTSVPGTVGSSVWGSPSLNPATNTVFLSTGNPLTNTPTSYSEAIIALNATTLRYTAEFQVPTAQVTGDGDFGITPTVFTPPGGVPLVSGENKNGYLYVLYQSNMSLAWEAKICCSAEGSTAGGGDNGHTSNAYANGVLYVVAPDSMVDGKFVNGTTLAFNARTGTLLWQDGLSASPAGGYAAPLFFNDLLLVPSDQTIYVLNATSGAPLTQLVPGGAIAAPASVARGQIYVGTEESRVFDLDTSLISHVQITPRTGGAPLTVVYSVQGEGGLLPYTYSWNFGDGTTSSLESGTHAFASPGSYAVTATVEDYLHRSSSHKFIINVSSNATGGPGTYLVSGQDVLANGTPVAGASTSVVLGKRTVTHLSSASGRWTFLVANGTYRFTITDTGYVTAHVTATDQGRNISVGRVVLTPSTTPPTAYYRVAGEVENSAGVGLVGATVSYPANGTNRSVTTTSGGAFSLVLPNGTFLLTARDPGHEGEQQNVIVAGASLASPTFQLLVPTSASAFTVSGRVVTASGAALAGATVKVAVGGRTESTTSSSAGYWSFLLGNGTYTFTVSLSGYANVSLTVTVGGYAFYTGHQVMSPGPEGSASRSVSTGLPLRAPRLYPPPPAGRGPVGRA